MSSFKERLLKVIPGGAHTYSRGHDQFPSNAPQILSRGEGAYVFCPKGKRWLDYGMGLRAVNIGYSEPEIDRAAIDAIKRGNNLTRPSIIELEAAEELVDLISSAEMVKFTKNGSTSVTAAVKLSRAFTNRDKIVRCTQQPFLSYDDWFIASTPLKRGVPDETSKNIMNFSYGDVAGLTGLFERFPNQVACVVIEAATTEHPPAGFLEAVGRLCKENGAVFVLDEMITGFRWHLRGAQKYYGIKPDISTFGKAMANGFSVSCICGRKEIMGLGSIENLGAERVFLLSSTHGAEMSSLAAFLATVDFVKKNGVVEYVWQYGARLTEMMNNVAYEIGVSEYFSVAGIPCSPVYNTMDRDGLSSLPLRTLFSQEMIKQGVLMPWIALSYRHGPTELDLTRRALTHALCKYKEALSAGTKGLLIGDPIKPVFRKYN